VPFEHVQYAQLVGLFMRVNFVKFHISNNTFQKASLGGAIQFAQFGNTSNQICTVFPARLPSPSALSALVILSLS